ncbi:hypothetical protein C2G38_2027931 [Gigaspora rosea]|uniref:Uncharacterized protein n=1 Tax=Gigaspora rosea TaxID=44941 RepID=A0A397W506_9GLOM|nr:hypothetical protein C2G38_2027931 [Gigaspora rosea]
MTSGEIISLLLKFIRDNSKTALGKKIWFYEKTLNLAIATGRVKELYAIHKDFIGEMENEVASQVSCADNIAEFALIINNPIVIKTKSQPKGSNNTNADIKGKENRFLDPIKMTKKIRPKDLKKYYKMRI